MKALFDQPLTRAALLALLLAAAAIASVRARKLLQAEGTLAAEPASAAGEARGNGTPPLRILLIGNSLSAPLPRWLLAFGRAAGRPLEVRAEAPGGQTLAYHASAPSTLRALRETSWDIVVLQEQSVIPSLPETQRSREMYPPALQLVNLIRERGAQPWLYATFARRAGDAQQLKADSYELMQDRIDEGYRVLAGLSQTRVLPVGSAFRSARRDLLDELWLPDGIHASPAGELLAASVLFAALLRIDPVPLAVDAGLEPKRAWKVREVAARTVRSELKLPLAVAKQ